MGKKKRKRRRKEPQRTNEELVALIHQGDDYYMGALLEQNEAYIRWNMGKLSICKVRKNHTVPDFPYSGTIWFFCLYAKHSLYFGFFFSSSQSSSVNCGI